MARLPRLSVGGFPHLLVQRAHEGLAVFADDTDRSLYRQLLGDLAKAEGVALHAYALLDHEVRLLATPQGPEALGRLMQGLGRRYGGAFNRRHGRAGSLWSGRFRVTVLEPERHLLDAMRFVEDASNWDGRPDDAGPASSRGHHLGRRADPLLHDAAPFWALGNTPFEREVRYRALLDEGLPPRARMALEQAVATGWPLGDAEFIARLGQQTDRRLAPLKRGRPPKPRPDV